MNQTPSETKTTPRNRIRYREATPRDGLAMWRLRRQSSRREPVSPFFYMAVLQRLAHSCVVAEVHGEVIGYVLARRSDERAALRVFDLTVDAAEDAEMITAALLTRLVKLPAHADVRYLDAEQSAHRAVKRLLEEVGGSTDATGNGLCFDNDGADAAGSVAHGV